MKCKRYVWILLSLLYLDLIFNLFLYDSYLRNTIINIFLFSLINSVVVYLVTGIFKEKVNRIISICIYACLWFWYGLYYVFYKVFVTPFSIALFRQSDQTLKFGKNIIISILQNLHVLILLAVPLILIIIFKKKMNFQKLKLNNLLKYGIFGIAFILIYIGNIFLQGRGVGSTYSLYFDTNNVALNIERLGVPAALLMDVKRSIFGFEEKVVPTVDISSDEEDLFDYDYNNLDIKFNGNNKTINDFMNKESGTKQNKYTGMFKDKNLIFIVAESFSEVAVREDITPTLYKLVHEGFYFKNFYTSNNLSTIGGEFQALTGLYADNSILSNWRSGKDYYPYGLGNVFGGLGYKTYAYHNNSAYYQDRNVYLKSQGLSNYKGCYNGLEKLINCEQWPQSDVEMVSVTTNDYVNNDEPFMTYYMTVSGHFYYDFSQDAMARKNRNVVKDLNYNESSKAYLASQVELDNALKLLLERLEESGKLDDTVIVLLADHYPYGLGNDNLNSLSSYYRDGMIEVNSNSLIIYNSKMKPVTVDKVGMSIDVLPTVLNLFGVSYDSRLIMGKDILSSNLGLAIFKDMSWVTDKGTYYASNGKFVANGETPGQEYIDNVNNIVSNRVAISRMIVQSNYYKSIKAS